MIWPLWQYPHCGTFKLRHAASTRMPIGVAPIASMVVTFLPWAAEIGVTHERIGAPSRCTVHAPHRAMPQPNLVPVSPSSSRSVHKSGVSSGTSTSTRLPLMSRVVIPAILLETDLALVMAADRGGLQAH